MSHVKTPADSPGHTRLHRFGAHMSIAGGVDHALREAHRLRCDAVQLFVKNQRQWHAAPLAPAVLERWHALRAALNLAPPVAHATYLVNLASPDRALWRRSVTAFAQELARCAVLDIPYLVVHPGSATDGKRSAGLRRVARALDQILDGPPDKTPHVLLETTAGQGRTLGVSFAELGEILGRVSAPERVGICIDTCHVFAAGYDLRAAPAYAAMVNELAREVGLHRVRCWHLNDCLGDCGSRLDRHAHIGRGQIGAAGFMHVLADHRFRGLPMILETPKGKDARGREWDRQNLRRLRTLATRALRDGHAGTP